MMRYRFFLFFVFYTLLFLFYPGSNHYYLIFAYNRQLFNQQKKEVKVKINPVPYLKFFYYPEVSAEGVYVVDLNSFTPIFEKNPHKKFIPASTTKIITALTAFDLFSPEEVVRVKKVINEGRVMNLKLNEKITVENLLYGILIHSANDAAYALADYYGLEKFIKLMNLKAKNLKMENSRFIDPAGLSDYNQYSTPFDLALAGRYFLKNKYLSKMVSTKEIIISDVEFKTFHTLSNVNRLLGEIPGLGGLKTGYTENAGENLISFYKKNDHQYIIVVLKSLNRFQDTSLIIDWLNNNVSYLNLEI